MSAKSVLVTPIPRTRLDRLARWVAVREHKDHALSGVVIGMCSIWMLALGFGIIHELDTRRDVLPAVLWWLGLVLFITPMIGCLWLDRRGKRGSVAISATPSQDEAYRYDAYRVTNYRRHVIDGNTAFWTMEPVLQAECRELYRAMLRALRRWRIAQEYIALEAAAQRGLMLREIKHEGVLTRAHQIPLDDDADLAYGQNIVDSMRQIRRELEQ